MNHSNLKSRITITEHMLESKCNPSDTKLLVHMIFNQVEIMKRLDEMEV